MHKLNLSEARLAAKMISVPQESDKHFSGISLFNGLISDCRQMGLRMLIFFSFEGSVVSEGDCEQD